MTLSTLNVAANNTHCKVPLFVQVRSFFPPQTYSFFKFNFQQVMDRGRAHYVGVFSDRNYRTSYEMAVITGRPPPDIQRLGDFARVFKDKVKALSFLFVLKNS